MINDMIIINDLLEEFYVELKEDIRSNKDLYYNCYVFKEPPATPLLPNIQVSAIGVQKDENLSYGERKWTLMLDVNLYAQDTHTYERRTIARDLQEKLHDFYVNEKGLGCTFNKEIFNLDANVHRINLKFRGVYDLNTGITYKK